jgi:hypothetical protein
MDTISSLDYFNELLLEYIRKHNTTIHSSTGQTPMDRFLHTKSSITVPKSNEWLDESFHNRMIRNVNNDACISINKVSYDAPQQFIGMKMEVRFLPGSMEEAYILYDGEHYPIHSTDKVANGKTKRNNNFNPLDYSKLGGTKHV